MILLFLRDLRKSISRTFTCAFISANTHGDDLPRTHLTIRGVCLLNAAVRIFIHYIPGFFLIFYSYKRFPNMRFGSFEIAYLDHTCGSLYQ